MTLWYRPIKPGTKPIKRMRVKIALMIIGRAFQSVSRHDPDINTEIDILKEGFTVMVKLLPKGSVLCLEKRGDRLVPRSSRSVPADLEFGFLTIESAYSVLTAKMGIHQAMVEKRIQIKGDLGQAMVVMRSWNVLMFYLYPFNTAKRLVKRVPQAKTNRVGLRLWLYSFGILLGI